MIYKEYDPKTLKKLQQTELGILKDFDEFCRDNDIDYFACGGTAIGVVRHNGFIPWDDDIDVGMTRENYNKFLEIFDRFPEKYKLITYETTKNFPLMNTRLALKGTRFKEDCFRELDLDNGIFLDIFCFDHIFDDDKKMKRQGYSAWLWGKLLILWYIDDPVLYQKGIMSLIVHLGCVVVHRLLRIMLNESDKLYERARRYSTLLSGKRTKRIAYMFDPKPFTSIVYLDDIEPTVDGIFEGCLIKIPRNVKMYLEKRYGNDYMTLPPESKRHNHPPYELEFDDKQKELI